jgi:septum formation protein
MTALHPFLPPVAEPLVLASRSPRRAEILRQHRLDFEVDPPQVDESPYPGEAPDAHVNRLALEKAAAVGRRRPEALCLGCDTVVVLDGEILGKPADPAAARAMLTRLAGREHLVYSSVALFQAARGHHAGDHRVTRVRFRRLDEAEIAAYVATGEPMDKAGAYGIQGFGSMLVASIEGCYFNVMGLPVEALRRLWLAYAEA